MIWTFVVIAVTVLAYSTYTQVIQLRRQIATLTESNEQQTSMLIALLEKQGIDPAILDEDREES
ncbi:MAG TPA: hypothetical protein VGC74_15875 [Stenotrophomonas sp.]|jgi:hypothetical protein